MFVAEVLNKAFYRAVNTTLSTLLPSHPDSHSLSTHETTNMTTQELSTASPSLNFSATASPQDCSIDFDFDIFFPGKGNLSGGNSNWARKIRYASLAYYLATALYKRYV